MWLHRCLWLTDLWLQRNLWLQGGPWLYRSLWLLGLCFIQLHNSRLHTRVLGKEDSQSFPHWTTCSFGSRCALLLRAAQAISTVRACTGQEKQAENLKGVSPPTPAMFLSLFFQQLSRLDYVAHFRPTLVMHFNILCDTISFCSLYWKLCHAFVLRKGLHP